MTSSRCGGSRVAVIPNVGDGGKRRYGRGRADEDETRCIASVMAGHPWIPSSEYHQCRFKRGHGPGMLFCRLHAKLAERQQWQPPAEGEGRNE